MSKNCEECGTELSSRNSRYLGTKCLCNSCYDRLNPPSVSVSPELAKRGTQASLGSRLGGQVVDWFISLFLFIIGLAIVAVWEKIFGSVINAVILIFAYLPAIGYYLMADALPGGQSLGKRVVGTKVIDSTTGDPCSLGQSIGRNALGILGIFDWVFIFGEFKQRLGDMAANTIVVWK